MAEDEAIVAIPNLRLNNDEFLLRQDSAHSAGALERIIDGIKAQEMAPYLERLMGDAALSKHFAGQGALLEELRAKNKAHLEELQEKLAVAQDQRKNVAGAVDEGDVVKSIALYHTQIGGKESALAAARTWYDKAVGTGQKIDVQLMMVRIGYFHWDPAIVRGHLATTRDLVASGGDWDRRNRLRAYEGLMLLWERRMDEGAAQLLEALPTFAATELMPLPQFIELCTVCGLLVLDRKAIKANLLDAPDVRVILPTSAPELLALLRALYAGDYRTYFLNLAAVEENRLACDPILSLHSRFITRQLRVKAYNQFLESYRSVTLASLADAFGVTPAYLDDDLCKFIAAGFVHCSIDRVHGIVETRRADFHNQKFEQLIRSGDGLLTNIQSLSKILS